MQTAPQRWLAEGRSRTKTIELPSGVVISPPDEYHFPAGMLARLRLTLVTRMSRPLSGNLGMEPTSFRNPVNYTNDLTGEQTHYTRDQLTPHTSPLVKGGFYQNLPT